MPFADRQDNRHFPADLSEAFSLWNVIVTIWEAQQKIREGPNWLSTQCLEN